MLYSVRSLVYITTSLLVSLPILAGPTFDQTRTFCRAPYAMAAQLAVLSASTREQALTHSLQLGANIRAFRSNTVSVDLLNQCADQILHVGSQIAEAKVFSAKQFSIGYLENQAATTPTQQPNLIKNCVISIQSSYQMIGQNSNAPDIELCRLQGECPAIYQQRLNHPEVLKFARGGHEISCSQLK